MLLLGIDLGTSSVKASVVDAQTQLCVASAQFPETEAEIISLQQGWAEQSPETWWNFVQQAILKVNASHLYDAKDISAIGIAYQMHGLVLIDANQNVLRNSIIWCDSRAVSFGEQAFHAIGEEKCLSHLLNSPGNFTASKLAWVKKNEPELFENIDQVLLPGDFIAMKLTGTTTTSISALSEGIFWDFSTDEISNELLHYFGFDKKLFPKVQPVFSTHGLLKKDVADSLSLKVNIPVTYKAGDQPNNALSLNVLQPGEVAATAGSSGVIYGVSDSLKYDLQSRVNTFAHVNYQPNDKRLGVLLCINGTGILNKWIKNLAGKNLSYQQINESAQQVNIGSDGLKILPFGNGAERMLNNKIVHSHIQNIDLNKHGTSHVFRAAQEGIAFAFRYGLDIMRENDMHPNVIRAGKANMFLSTIFTEAFVNATQVPVELYSSDGSAGAAIGAGLGAAIYKNEKEALCHFKPLALIEPSKKQQYNDLYQEWKEVLMSHIQ
jgi:xylulokinase